MWFHVFPCKTAKTDRIMQSLQILCACFTKPEKILFVYACTYVCMCMYAYMNLDMYACMYVCAYVVMYASMLERNANLIFATVEGQQKLDRYVYQSRKQGRILMVVTSQEYIIEVMKCRCRLQPRLTSIGVYFITKSCGL